MGAQVRYIIQSRFARVQKWRIRRKHFVEIGSTDEYINGQSHFFKFIWILGSISDFFGVLLGSCLFGSSAARVNCCKLTDFLTNVCGRSEICCCVSRSFSHFETQMEHETATILLALLCIGLVFAFPPDHKFETSKRVQYCGSKLSSAISIVCHGYYNTLISRQQQAMPFINPTDAKAMLRRRRRGITDECCRNSCTLDELRTFCGQ